MDDNGLLSQPISSAEKSEDMFNLRISNMMDGQTPQDSIDYINLLTYLLTYYAMHSIDRAKTVDAAGTQQIGGHLIMDGPHAH